MRLTANATLKQNFDTVSEISHEREIEEVPTSSQIRENRTDVQVAKAAGVSENTFRKHLRKVKKKFRDFESFFVA